MTGLASEARNAPGNARAVMASRDPQADDVDFFPTQPWGARPAGEIIRRIDPKARTAWECACGPGMMVHALADYFAQVFASDAYLYDGNLIHDFLGEAEPDFLPEGGVDWIVTNPPFSNLEAFILRAWAMARRGVAMLLPARALHGIERFGLLFGTVPLTVYAPFSERLPMHKGVYDPDRSTAAEYAWFFFLKPVLRPRRFMIRVGDDWLPGVLPIGPGTKKRLFRASDLKFAAGGQARAAVARMVAGGFGALGEAQLDLLEKVARDGGSRGVTAAAQTYPGGLLATLKAAGVLEHAPELKGDEGERRFRVSGDGRAILIARERL